MRLEIPRLSWMPLIGLWFSCVAPPADRNFAAESSREALTGPMMAQPRNEPAVALMTNGQVLVAGGGQDAGYLRTAEIYDISTNQWTAAAPMTFARRAATTVTLRDGTILVAGGEQPVTNVAERYDPGTNQWTTVMPMQTARFLAAANVLPDGRGLVCGGRSSTGASLRSCEFFLPATNTWSSAPSMIATRSDFPSVAVNGGVFVVSGTSSEFFDPVQDQWSTQASPPTLGSTLTATVLQDGRILVRGSTAFSLYAPSTNTWTAAAALSSTRGNATTTLLPNGRVLAIGGSSASIPSNVVEIFNPTDNQWTALPSLVEARFDHVSVLLPTGQVLVIGGEVTGAVATRSVELLGVFTPTLTQVASAPFSLSGGSAALLGDGRVLLAGGASSGLRAATFNSSQNLVSPTVDSASAHRLGDTASLASGNTIIVGPNSSEMYDLSSNTFMAEASLPAARSFLRVATLADDTLMAAGGTSDAGCVSEAQTLVGTPYSWQSLQNQPPATCEPTLTLLPNGGVHLAGEGMFQDYAPASGAWTPSVNSPTALRGHASALLWDGRVLHIGGRNGTLAPSLAATTFYSPTTRQVSSGPPLMNARTNHRAVGLWNGKVLVVGDGVAGSATSITELYDPVGNAFAPGPVSSVPIEDAAAQMGVDGRVYVFTGTSVLAFDEGRGTNSAVAPTLNTLPPLRPGATVALTGTGFIADSEGSSGSYTSSPTNYPLFMLMRQGNQALYFGRTIGWTDTTAQVVLPANLPAGLFLARVVVNGMLSEGRVAPVMLSVGTSCGISQACGSGFCVDGVCCNSACAGACDVCSVALGASANGTCSLVTGTTCRASTGVCDLAESCDGMSATCPPEQPLAPTCSSDAGPSDGGSEGGDGGSPPRVGLTGPYTIHCGCGSALDISVLWLALLATLRKKRR